MSVSRTLTPTVSVATAYKVAFAVQPALAFSQALQPFCQMTGVNQSVTPQPSPSR